MRSTIVLFALTVVLACDGTFLTPDEFRDIAPPTLTDQNPDPNIVEVQLVAGLGEAEYLPGKKAAVWAYRDGAVPGAKGTIPGPTIEVRRGNKVIVHYRNELDAQTTVHWHGLRLPNMADGTSSSQVPVGLGGTFTYEFVAQDEGTFWYHPHLEADVMIERGLYGALRVLGDAGPTVAADRIFVLDDVKIEGDGQLSTRTSPLDIMLGRQGNILLVNGRPDARIAAEAGTRERWRFVNSANGRYFNLRFGDRPFLVIAWDGGPLPQPYQTDHLLVAPGERYEVLVTFSSDGDVKERLRLQTVHYDRGHNIPDQGPLDLMEVRVLPSVPRSRGPESPIAVGEWSPLPVDANTPRRQFELKEVEMAGGDVKFFINDEAFPKHTPIHGAENAVEVWEIKNVTEMDHPFHLHGMFFQVLDVNGKAPMHRGLKDTVNVPHKATLRFAVRYGTPGHWMFHCHILEHAERGMMGELMIAGH